MTDSGQLRLRVRRRHSQSMKQLDETYEAYIVQLLKQKQAIAASLLVQHDACMDKINAIEFGHERHNHMQRSHHPSDIALEFCSDSDSSVSEHVANAAAETHVQNHDDDDDSNANDATATSKPFSCKHCDFESAWPSSVRRHERTVHGNNDEQQSDAVEEVDEGVIQDNDGDEDDAMPPRRKPGKNASNRYQCSYCEYNTPYRHVWKDHELRHRGEKPYKCPDCDYRSVRQYELTVHRRKKHVNDSDDNEDDGNEDDENDDNADDDDDEHGHVQTPVPLRKSGQNYACRYCEYTTPYGHNMRDHEMRHRGEKPFKCGFCEYRSTTRYAVSLHERRIHTNDRPHQCDKCQRRFVQICDLKQHQRTHFTRVKNLDQTVDNNEDHGHHAQDEDDGQDEDDEHDEDDEDTMVESRWHQCHYCDYKVKRRSHLRVHEMRHRNEKPFQCRFCEHKAAQKHDITMHERRIHTKEKPFQCSKCKKAFYRNCELTNHQQNNPKCRRRRNISKK